MIVVDREKPDNIILLDHGNIRYVSDYIANKYKYDNGFDGIQSLNNVTFDVVDIDIDKNIKEVRVNSFDTHESLDSLFVKTAKNIDISKIPPIKFNKKFIVDNNNKLYIPQNVNKNTMLFNTFKNLNNASIAGYGKTMLFK